MNSVSVSLHNYTPNDVRFIYFLLLLKALDLF